MLLRSHEEGSEQNRRQEAGGDRDYMDGRGEEGCALSPFLGPVLWTRSGMLHTRSLSLTGMTSTHNNIDWNNTQKKNTR